MKRRTLYSFLIICVLAFSLAMLPYLGLPYEPLRVMGSQWTGYEDPPVYLYLPIILGE